MNPQWDTRLAPITLRSQLFDIELFEVGVYQQGVLAQLMEFPLMDLRYGWARDIVKSLYHVCRFAVLLANRRNQPESRRLVQCLIDDNLSVLVKRCTDERKVQDTKKKQVDAGRLQYYPSNEVIKMEVRKAMGRLAIIHKEYAQKDEMPYPIRLEASTLVVGIIYFNSFAGRSGEWETMTKSHVLSQRSWKLISGVQI